MEAEYPPSRVSFPVVGIGASAGGYAALMTLLQNMPPSPGMALVVILHLAPGEPSSADRLLQSGTDMPVVQVTHPMPILPDKVYVIPPDRSLTIRDGQLVLDQLDRSGGRPVAIDIFLRTLGKAHREHAVGIVLSGMGSDGTAGLGCIKEMGGVTIVQMPSDAEYGSMPRSVIESGMADFVLTASAIPGKLLELRDSMIAIRQHADAGKRLDEVPLDMGPQPEVALRDVLDLLHARTGHDFRHYRHPTLLRQLERRLQVRGTPDLAGYYRALQKDVAEARALMKDLLIGVTSFYRDPEAFKALERTVLPALFQSAGQPLRAWVAACSTGEEAYTVAMLLAGQAAQQEGGAQWQVFASDLDEHAIAIARAGLYPDSIAESVPEAQLQHWFTREADQYKVRKSLRDHMLFAHHNLLHEPAFSRLDLISCRNFLIYLDRDMHRQLLRQFHFALNPGGYLMLGSAEPADTATDLFVPVDPAQKIYRARPAAQKPSASPRTHAAAPASASDKKALAEGLVKEAALDASRRGKLFSFADIHMHKAVAMAPPSILLTADGDILHVSERAAHFLRQAGGEPTRDLARLVLPELQLALRVALFQARQSGNPASTGPLRFQGERSAGTVDIEVQPFTDAHSEGTLMLARFVGLAGAAPPAAPAPPQDHVMLRQLDEELRSTRKRLIDTLEQVEADGAETQLYSEEMQTTVEALRSAGAELQQGRDELLLANRELTATNLELQTQVSDAAKAHDDLVNLIASSDVATIFLDRDMRILRYTPRIAEFFSVIPADLGRPLLHITSRLDNPRLAEDAAQVFVTLQAMEREVRTRNGRYYIVRVHPYRTKEHRIDGAVMSFFDITGRRAAEEALRVSEQRLRLFVTASSDIIYQMNADWSEMRILRGKGLLPDTEAPSASWLDTYIPEQDRTQIQAAIARAIAGRSTFELEHRVIGKDGSIAWTFSRAVPLLDADGGIVEWFGAAVDITQRKRDEEAKRESEARLSTIFESLPVGLCVMRPNGTMLLSNRLMHHYLPTGVMPSRDPVRGGRWRAWHEDGRPLEPNEFPGARALRGERIVPGIEMLFRQDDGRETWTQVAGAAVIDGEGRATGEAAVVITDIDAQKRIESALRENELRMRDLLGGVALAVWETDAEGRVNADSPSWRAYTGQRVEEWLGDGWIEAVHPDDRSEAMRQWNEAVRRRDAVDIGLRLHGRDGTWHRCRARALPLFDIDGSVRKWVGINVETDGGRQ